MCVHLINLTVGYDDHVLFSGITAHARAGAVTVVLGPEGVGKSTLLRTLAGGSPALAGRVCLDGADLDALAPAERSRLVALLPDDAVPACPGLLLLDQSDSALDGPARARLTARLRELAARHDAAVVVTTRDPDLAVAAGDTLWLLTPDGLLRTGTPAHLTEAGHIAAAFDPTGHAPTRHASTGHALTGHAPTVAPEPDAPGTRAVGARRADPARVRAAVTDAATRCRYVSGTDPGDGVALRALPADRALLAEHVDQVCWALGVRETRVAASLLHFRLVAGVWSLALAAPGLVPDLDRLRVRLDPKTTLRLSLPDPGGWTAADPVPLLTRAVVDDLLRPLHDALHAATRVARGLLWGNAAASLAAALRAVPNAPAERLTAVPELAAALAGDGRRRSCCLHYRTPTATTCYDCPLTPATAPGTPPRARA
ncbi:ATP-binding cassette domain-containing protein [Actinokineospora sp. PR83]|uniref:ATP-binding cassette domain-containing protein n=1 Tax=Actinokineospora sp. PR83 TaxID=2884908 RepID=UPI001F3E95DB|nr:ATP-binding cassette domain-containing protein [Actinokineospora sp. PR83]MCG8916042.1 ATP-binding cassette domain-containing protein [Actinokineospora sp. PR83]